jgi:hypothetical protein
MISSESLSILFILYVPLLFNMFLSLLYHIYMSLHFPTIIVLVRRPADHDDILDGSHLVTSRML